MFSSSGSTSSKTTSGKSRPSSIAASRARSIVSASSVVRALIDSLSRWRPVRDAADASARSPPAPQELADARDDPVLVGDVGRDEFVAAGEALIEVVLELARAVRALHLSVAEEVRLRDELLVEQAQALGGVAAGPVVAVGEVEAVDVP